jgi:CRP-like cAMP-binding protein
VAEPTPVEEQPRGWAREEAEAPAPVGGEEQEDTSPGEGPRGVIDAERDPVGAALHLSAREGKSVESMPVFPLLSDLPRAAFVDLVRQLRIVERGPSEVLLAEGGAGDAFYLIAEGTVRVRKGVTEVALLGSGSFFGEFAVLSDQRRHADVESVTAVRLLEIDKALLDRLVAAHPGVARTLRAFYGDRLLSTLLLTAPFFAGLQPEERADVATRFRPRRFGRGATIVEQGAAGGGLYLILVGEVEVVRSDEAGDVELARLGEGSYFGEMSLLKGATASATVRASRLCEIVQLPPRDFYEIVSRHPVLWEQLRVEVQRRELTNVAILAGEARGDEHGGVYLV